VLAELLAAAEAIPPGDAPSVVSPAPGEDLGGSLPSTLETLLRDMLPPGPPDEIEVQPDPNDVLRAENLPLDGWRLAASLAAGDLRWMDDDVKRHAEQLAAAAVLQRAQRLVGPLRGPTRLERGEQLAPGDGELDIEATLDNIVGKEYADAEDIVVERRVEQRRQVVLMVDTSGSMAGENMALAAVAAAVLALKMHPGDLGIVAFSAEARDIVRIGEQPPVREIVRRLLDRPCAGPTNIAAGLESGAHQLGRGRDPRRSAVLISDGQYTVGHDPRKAAARFPSLHVLHTLAAEHRAGPGGYWITPLRQVGADVARIGGGRLVPVRSFEELPRRMLDVADMVLR
jgi:Mg-chelatase subunit ChlD